MTIHLHVWCQVVVLALLVGLGSFVPSLTKAQSQDVTLSISSTNCPAETVAALADQAPGQALGLEGCFPAIGVAFTVDNSDGDRLGQCATETANPNGLTASCEVAGIPSTLTVIVTQDPTSLGPGIIPDTNNPITYDLNTLGSGSVGFEFVNTDESLGVPASETLAYPVMAYLCDTDPGDYSPNGGPALGGGCEPVAGVAFAVALASDGSEVGTCTTGDDGTCTVDTPNEAQVIVTEDESTVPNGYAPRDNPQTDRNASEFRGTLFFNIVGDEAGTSQPTEATTEALADETDGSTAAIYAGDCDGDFTDEGIARLTNVRAPSGETRGAADASSVGTSFTTLDLPLGDILEGDRVLVVFDEIDDSVVLTCGAVGGILTDDGTVAFGLPAIGESLFSGIAYLSEDGDQTEATIFLAKDLSAEATPAA